MVKAHDVPDTQWPFAVWTRTMSVQIVLHGILDYAWLMRSLITISDHDDAMLVNVKRTLANDTCIILQWDL